MLYNRLHMHMHSTIYTCAGPRVGQMLDLVCCIMSNVCGFVYILRLKETVYDVCMHLCQLMYMKLFKVTETCYGRQNVNISVEKSGESILI